MPGVGVMNDERRKFQLPRSAGLGRGRRLPYFYSSPYHNGEMPAFGREGQCRHRVPESEVIQRETAVEMGQDGVAILTNGKKEVTSWSESEASDVPSVGKWKCIGLVTTLLSKRKTE